MVYIALGDLMKKLAKKLFVDKTDQIAATIAFFISVLANYYLSTSWVFNQTQIENKALEFNVFLAISIVGWIFTEILLYVFTDLCSINYLWSKIIASILVLFWNFSARRVMFYGKKI